ncbi:unnamed protein product [Peronospora belbahrii]|uniref:Uncharacterized protein n=1 Tax=Peronospora belbahrii TaxID=622444 RepID=A0AAU9LFF4_9STRA|nr:unnamed protein product [Peronospora belbahrii]
MNGLHYDLSTDQSHNSLTSSILPLSSPYSPVNKAIAAKTMLEMAKPNDDTDDELNEPSIDDEVVSLVTRSFEVVSSVGKAEPDDEDEELETSDMDNPVSHDSTTV